MCLTIFKPLTITIYPNRTLKRFHILIERYIKELMTPDEVRALDNDHCILFVRGELPVMDRKYDILKHPGLKLTEDGGTAPYIHRPGLTYALEDLPLSTDNWESIEIIE